MNDGFPIQRQFVLLSNTGAIVIDWGEQRYLDVFTGEAFVVKDDNLMAPVQEAELIYLKNAGIITSYDHQQVYFSNLPQQP